MKIVADESVDKQIVEALRNVGFTAKYTRFRILTRGNTKSRPCESDNRKLATKP